MDPELGGAADPLGRRARAGRRPRARRALPAPRGARPSAAEPCWSCTSRGRVRGARGYLADELRAATSSRISTSATACRAAAPRASPAPPEPCPLPLARRRAAGRASPAARRGPFRIGEWEPTLERRRATRRRSRRYARRSRAATSTRSTSCSTCRRRSRATRRRSRRRSRRCGRSHPRPFDGDGWAIVSASPELFLARRGDRLVTMPIKGTRPAGEDVDDAKDAAEHVMIVDLERNDLSRVCEPGSIRWPELMAQHELAGVTHLVSTVEGRLRAGRRRSRRSSRPRSPAARSPARRRSPAIDHDRAARAGRARRVDGRARHACCANGDFDLALTIRTFAVADGPDPPLGRRRHRLGLRAGGRDRGVVGQGAAAARRGRRAGARMKLLAVAVAGAASSIRDEPVFARRRRGAAARRRRLRDAARLRRPAVPARPSTSSACAAPPRARAAAARRAPSSSRTLVGGRARPDGVLRLYRTAHDARRDGRPRSRRARGAARARPARSRSVELGRAAGPRRREVDELRGRFRRAARGRARRAPTTRSSSRDGVVLEARDGERLVAARRRAVHAGARRRRAARRDARRA